MKKWLSIILSISMILSLCNLTVLADGTTTVPTYAQELVNLKLVQGYEDGDLKLEQNITRAETAKLVLGAKGLSNIQAAESANTENQFADCVNHWGKKYINTGVNQGYINGMGDGTFRPDDNITYGQIVKMLVCILGYDYQAESLGGYPNGYIQVASAIGLSNGVDDVKAEDKVTRGQVMQILDNALSIPLVEVTSWTTDTFGNPVAVREVMDGTGDSEKYHTLLTKYHNAYKVKGRVEATHAQGNCDADKVKYSVEYSDNFDGDKIAAGKSKKDYANVATHIEAFYDQTNAPDLLFTYSEAVIQKDAYDEYHILSITTFGKNDIVELKADNYESYDGDTIEFTISDTSSKTKSYKLSDDCEFYVNGIQIKDSVEAIENYVIGNKIGTVTLIDTPAEGSASKDGKYDYVMITFAKWAVVDSTTSNSKEDKIYFDDFEAGTGMTANLTMDTTDNDKVYTFVKNNADCTFNDIDKDDVLLLYYDVTGNLNDSDYVKVDVSSDVVEGTVSSVKQDGKDYIYTVNGNEYKYVNDDINNEATFKSGDTYTFYLDATRRIVKYDETTSAKNYGIVDRVYYDNNSGDDKIRIIKNDGTRVNYVLKSADDTVDAQEIAYGEEVFDGTLKAINDRVISYKINSKNEVHTIVNLTAQAAEGEYKTASTKVGSAKMNDATAIFDLTGTDPTQHSDEKWYNDFDYTASDLKSAKLSTFVSGEEYDVLYGDKNADGYAKFVIILTGNSSVNVQTHFAVIDSVGTSTIDSIEVVSFTMYTADSQGDLVTYYADEDESCTAADFNRGDVIVYGLTNDDRMKDIQGIFSTNENLNDDLFTLNAAYNMSEIPSISGDTVANAKWYIRSFVPAWDFSTASDSNGYARTGFGAIINKNGNNITFGKVAQATTDILDKDGNIAVPTNGYYSIEGTQTCDFDITSSAKVYVIDLSEKDKANSDRLTAGSTGSIAKTNVPKTMIAEDASGNDIYNWSTIANENINPNYAYFKTVDGDITDILVIIAKD